ncbi:glycosyltransferase family 4 protein [Actinospongicola halichondriae]|uniref:glycosyltransferase family 4 protein n=1 Tax=Actinospongicola halichondriae TaxID=3236844 RepID=UPI003D50235D
MTDTGARRPPGPLLFVTPRYPPFVGGTEVHAAAVARRLRSRGVDVRVLTTDTSADQARDTVVDGVPVRVIPARPKGGDLYHARTLDAEIAAAAPGAIHVQGYHTLLAASAMRSASRRGIPYVVTFHSGGHSSRLRNLLRPVHQRLLTPSFRRAAALVAVSEFEARLFASRTGLPRHRIEVIPSGSDLTLVPRTTVPDRTVITSMGRLERYKGHQTLLEALPHLLARRPDTEVRIIGSGSYERRLRRLVTKLDLEAHVRFLSVPSDERERLVGLLQESSLVTLLSAYESQGLAAFEAIAVDVPVMVLESTALAELSEAGLAAAVPPNTSPAGLASLIDAELRKPLVPRSTDPPGWDRTVGALFDLYERTTPIRAGDPEALAVESDDLGSEGR